MGNPSQTMATSRLLLRSISAGRPFGTVRPLWEPLALPRPGGIHRSGFRSSAVSAKEVISIESSTQFDQVVASNAGNLVVAYYTAVWCPPCRMIAPVYAQLAQENTEVTFLKIDVDEQQRLAANAGIEAMPTFKFMRDGTEVDAIVGADKNALAQKVEHHK